MMHDILGCNFHIPKHACLNGTVSGGSQLHQGKEKDVAEGLDEAQAVER